MEKITVEICMGTTCHIMGSSQFADLEETLPAAWKDRVCVKGMRCIGACQDENIGRAPFARVNGALIESASREKITTAIAREIEK